MLVPIILGVMFMILVNVVGAFVILKVTKGIGSIGEHFLGWAPLMVPVNVIALGLTIGLILVATAK